VYESAKVLSLAAVADFKAALADFRSEAKSALESAGLEARRMSDWLSHDQVTHWKAEIRRREERVNHALADLNRARICAVFGETPSCLDQKLALKNARASLEEAHDKLRRVGKWQRILEREIDDYQGPAQQLAVVLDGHLVQAGERLARLIDAVADYLATVPPRGPEDAKTASLGPGRAVVAVALCPDDADIESTPGPGALATVAPEVLARFMEGSP